MALAPKTESISSSLGANMGFDLLGSIGSAALGFIGQQQTNSANASQNQKNNQVTIDLQHEAQEFNEAEAEKARWFNRDQAQLSRDFNQAEAVTNWENTRRSQYEGNAFSSAQADKAREWEATMSNTAYQRATQDMKAAGLNPILAYAQGGASTPNSPSPSGSTPTGSAASGGAASGPSASTSGGHGTGSIPMQNPMGGMVSSALDFARTMTQLQNVQAQTDNTRAQTLQTHADTELSYARGATERGQPTMQAAQRDLMRLQGRYQEAGAGLASAQSLETQAREYMTREQIQHLQRHGGLPGPQQGMSFHIPGFGASLPPSTQRQEGPLADTIRRFLRLGQ